MTVLTFKPRDGQGPLARARPQVDLEVVVPAYNEEARIGEVLDALTAFLGAQPALSCAITVVDNGSVDRTAEEVDRFDGGPVPVTLIGCADQGKGAAVRRAVLASRARWVGFCDADLATPIATLGRVVPALAAGHDVVIASRRCEGAAYAVRQPVTRRVGSALFRQLARPLVGPVADTQCGFKFFQAPAARVLFGHSEISGFAFDVEVLALARAGGLSVVEVPVTWSDAEGSTVSMGGGLAAMRDVAVLRAQHALGRHDERLARVASELAALPAPSELAPVVSLRVAA
jgi:hypothetical protein